mgnify:CR=1 FL=1
MYTRQIKWIIYTVLVGLIPIISRLFIWITTKAGTIDVLSPADFIAFGLILHISNINEIEHIDDVAPAWKTIQNGSSIIFIAFYSVLFALSLVGDAFIEKHALLNCSITLSLVSLLLSCSVYYYLIKNERRATP